MHGSNWQHCLVGWPPDIDARCPARNAPGDHSAVRSVALYPRCRTLPAEQEGHLVTQILDRAAPTAPTARTLREVPDRAPAAIPFATPAALTSVALLTLVVVGVVVASTPVVIAAGFAAVIGGAWEARAVVTTAGR